jgi:hypothetical protein
MATRQLYEDAIADAKQVMSVAEDNAKRAIIDAVAPRIREALERSLLENQGLGPEQDDDALFSLAEPSALDGPGVDPMAAAISPPGPDGKMVLDLDGLEPEQDPAGSRDPGFVLNAEALSVLEPVVAGTGRWSAAETELQTYRLGEEIAAVVENDPRARQRPAFRRKIDEMISRVKNTYERVQESVTDSAKKRTLEAKLEAFNRALGRFTEMSKRGMGARVNEGEGEITLKLTGIDPSIDLDNVGVDLIKDEEEEGGTDVDGGGDLDLDGGSGDEGGDDLDLDLGGDDDGEDKKMGESRQRLSDNTVVEIDEGMLRREIARARSLREEAAPSTKGRAPRGAELDDFGGGSDEGDPWLDSDVPVGATSLKVVGEADGDDDEVLEIDMGEGDEPPLGECDDDMPMESMRRGRLASLREAVRRARRSGNARRIAEATAAYRRAYQTSGRATPSVARPRAGTRPNGGPRQTRAGAGLAERNLRSQLMQVNLRNAKLTATTKLLQNESLTAQQRADVVEKLESARSPREVKLVYETLVSSLTRRSRALSESTDRRVRGSSSRPTRPASTTLNESSEAARWAVLAGIR